jgi:hypothetical protein
MDPYGVKKLNFRSMLVSKYADFLQDKLFLEFGVMDGPSIIDFYNQYKSNKIKSDFFGFDAFLGLPEEKLDQHSPWKTGQFSMRGEIHSNLLAVPEINIVNGWFSDTLNESLLTRFGNKKIGIAHIDCDIYTSTVEVLDFIVENDLLCDGSILVYDDWGAYRSSGLSEEYEYSVAEARAHKEMVEKYNLTFDMVHKEIIDPTCYIMTVFRFRKN